MKETTEVDRPQNGKPFGLEDGTCYLIRGKTSGNELSALPRPRREGDAGDFFHWYTFYKPYRERLLAVERKRRERRRSHRAENLALNRLSAPPSLVRQST